MVKFDACGVYGGDAVGEMRCECMVMWGVAVVAVVVVEVKSMMCGGDVDCVA